MSSTPNSSRQGGGIHGSAKRQKTTHSYQDESGELVAQNTNNKLLTVSEGGQSNSEEHQPPSNHIATTPTNPTAVNQGPAPTSSEPQAASSTEESDDGEIFELLGDQGDGSVSRLCAHCQYIFDNWSEGCNIRGFQFPHYNDIFELEKSAINGCALCAQFLLGETTQELQNARDEEGVVGLYDFYTSGVTVKLDSFLILEKPTIPNERFVLCLNFRWSPSDDNDHHFVEGLEGLLFVVMMIHAIVPASIPDQKLCPTMKTSDALALSSRWLKRCRKTHWQCKLACEQYTPTRLVSTEKGKIRLCLGTNFETPPEYATLSHCWGETKFVQLESSNLEDFKNDIPKEALSQTFIDSITASQAMGFSYIWIDSLCILQDDPDDWKKESAMMSHVYGGSSLNIAASGASDGSTGCFFKRSQTWRCQVQIKLKDGIDRHDCVSLGMYSSSLSDMPLMRRGWAFQERLLPSRTLHFTSTQVFWECHQKVACETFPEEFPTSLTNSSSYFKKQPITRLDWSWIVERYTECKLTYPKDKLNAIGGLARSFQLHNCDQYIAGMWRKDLEFQLSWERCSSTKGQRVIPYRAPTWSWASLDCPIQTSTKHRPTALQDGVVLWIQILDIQIKPTGSNPLGPLSDATLSLSCSFLTHVTLSEDRLYSCMWVAENHLRVFLSFDCFDTCDDGLYKALVMPLFGNPVYGIIKCLILKSTGHEQGQYERVGTLQTEPTRDMDAFEKFIGESSCQAKDLEYARIRTDKYGKIHRIINLV